MIVTILAILGIWTLAAIPLGIVVGRTLARPTENTVSTTTEMIRS